MKLPNQSIGTVDTETWPPERASGSFSVVARLIALAALGFVSGALYWQARYLHSLKGGISEYIIVFLVQFSLYLAACYLVIRDKGSLWAGAGRWSKLAALSIVLLVAASFRAELVTQPPYLSSDVYRYIWDGRVQAAGINPYRYVPSAPELAYLRDDAIYTYINRRDFAHTIYPPVAQAIFLGINLISPSSVRGFKIAMSILDLAAIAAIMLALRRSGLAPVQAIVFAWHPLLIFESAHSGHVEAVFIAFLALALFAWSRRNDALTGFALALATLVKFYPVLLLPAFLIAKSDEQMNVSIDAKVNNVSRLLNRVAHKRNLVMLTAFVATVALAYLPYLGAGTNPFGFLRGYIQEEGFVQSGARYFLLDVFRRLVPIPTNVFLTLAAACLIGVAAWWLLRPKRDAVDVARGAAALIGCYLLLTTPRYAWYYAWLIPFLCLVPRAGWLYLTCASALLYLVWYTPLVYPQIPLWLGACIFLPAVVWLAWDRLSRRSEYRL